jgi:hypothetical protein
MSITRGGMGSASAAMGATRLKKSGIAASVVLTFFLFGDLGTDCNPASAMMRGNRLEGG